MSQTKEKCDMGNCNNKKISYCYCQKHTNETEKRLWQNNLRDVKNILIARDDKPKTYKLFYRKEETDGYYNITLGASNDCHVWSRSRITFTQVPFEGVKSIVRQLGKYLFDNEKHFEGFDLT